ncbi:MAG: secernin-2, partial [Propionibacteriaceae bacterium]|nr:secernin-2 [Propionibacteriaceae bacterium]
MTPGFVPTPPPPTRAARASRALDPPTSSSFAEEKRLTLCPLLAPLAEAGARAPARLSTTGARLPTLAAKRPWSCDTFVALPDVTADGSMLLAKNSDRPAGECQPLRYWPRRQSAATSSLRLAYVEIPDVGQSWAHLGGSPYWCWGHELGLNEWGVGIGNEAVFTRDLAEHVVQS